MDWDTVAVSCALSALAQPWLTSLAVPGRGQGRRQLARDFHTGRLISHHVLLTL